MRPGLLALLGSLLVLGQSIGLPLAVAVETCEASGVAYNCVTESIEKTTLNAAYENGYEGATNASTLPSPAADWPTSFAPGVDVPGGVHVSGTYENLGYLLSPNGTTASMSTSDQPRWINYSGLQTLTTGALHVLQYDFMLNASQLMNGASELYFRSAIQWNANYSAHYLNIVTIDADGHESGLIAAARYTETPVNTDANDSLMLSGRVYYHLSGLFATGQIYTVNEYVVTKGTPPLALPELPVFMDEGQDIAGDGLWHVRLFPGHAGVERIYGTDTSAQHFEVGWSARFFVGMGQGGTINVLLANESVGHTKLHFYNVRADAFVDSGSQTGNEVRIVLPLKTTQHLVNTTISVTPFRSFADRQAETTAGTTTTLTVPDTTGSLVVDVALPDADWTGAGVDHWYDIVVDLALPHTTCADSAGGECTLVSYPASAETLPNGNPNWHTAELGGFDFASMHVIYSQPWIDISEVHDDAAADRVHSSSSDQKLVPFLTMISGALLVGISYAAIGVAAALVFVTAPVTIPIIVGAVFITGAAIVGVGLGICGIRAGGQGMDWTACLNKETLENVGKGLFTLAAAASCAAVVLPGIGIAARIALSATCVATGSIALCDIVTGQGVGACINGFLRVVGDVIKVIKEAVELLGQILFFIAEHLNSILTFAFILALVLAGPGIVKLFLVVVLAGAALIASLFKHQIRKPTDLPAFNRIFHFWIPLWSDVVERRLFGWNVTP